MEKTSTKKIPVKKQIKYCSDYDETCHELADPMKCFLGGNWTCQNGYSSYMPMADGVCKMMDILRGNHES